MPNKNRWRITLKLIFNKLAKEGVPWFHLAQGRYKPLADVNTGINLLFHKVWGIL
jgi:hypothetical protein